MHWLPNYGAVAQWQSRGLLSLVSWVRIPPASPFPAVSLRLTASLLRRALPTACDRDCLTLMRSTLPPLIPRRALSRSPLASRSAPGGRHISRGALLAAHFFAALVGMALARLRGLALRGLHKPSDSEAHRSVWIVAIGPALVRHRPGACGRFPCQRCVYQPGRRSGCLMGGGHYPFRRGLCRAWLAGTLVQGIHRRATGICGQRFSPGVPGLRWLGGSGSDRWLPAGIRAVPCGASVRDVRYEAQRSECTALGSESRTSVSHGPRCQLPSLM